MTCLFTLLLQVAMLRSAAIPLTRPVNPPADSDLIYTLPRVRRYVNKGQGPDRHGFRHQTLGPHTEGSGEGMSRRDMVKWLGARTPVRQILRYEYQCQVGHYVVVWITDKPGEDVWWVGRVVEKNSVGATVEYDGKPCLSLQWQYSGSRMALFKK